MDEDAAFKLAGIILKGHAGRMKYYLSTIADVDFSVENETEKITYIKRTAPAAAEYGLGLELAEFCISDNLDSGFGGVLPHFEYNINSTAYAVLHGPYNELFPHAIDRLVSHAARERYDWTWDLCRKYGIGKIILHANYVQTLYYPEWFTARQIEFWKDFMKDHHEDITVCLENVMEPYPELITDIVKGVGDERLCMCLDVGHANLTDVAPSEWLELCAPYISHYHIHNNRGPVNDERSSLGDTHSAPGNGIIDMKAFLERAEILTPDATAAIESADVEESAKWLKDNGFIK